MLYYHPPPGPPRMKFTNFTSMVNGTWLKPPEHFYCHDQSGTQLAILRLRTGPANCGLRVYGIGQVQLLSLVKTQSLVDFKGVCRTYESTMKLGQRPWWHESFHHCGCKPFLQRFNSLHRGWDTILTCLASCLSVNPSSPFKAGSLFAHRGFLCEFVLTMFLSSFCCSGELHGWPVDSRASS